MADAAFGGDGSTGDAKTTMDALNSFPGDERTFQLRKKFMSRNIASADFNLKMLGTAPMITRSIEFTDGSSVNFSVHMQRDDQATLPDLHRQSIENVIARLQELLAP